MNQSLSKKPTLKRRMARLKRKLLVQMRRSIPSPKVRFLGRGNTSVAKDIGLIKDYFDEGFYLMKYPDTVQMSGIEHYCAYGWREGRDPASWFSSSAYLASHPDVQEGDLNPFAHYLSLGKTEGRSLGIKNIDFAEFETPFLQREGQRLFVPVIYLFLKRLASYVQQHDVKTLFFLSREGYFLKRFYERGMKTGILPLVETRYLEVSRAFLFKQILAKKGADLTLTLNGDFSQSFRYMLQHRFCLTEIEIDQLKIDDKELDLQVSLPGNRDTIIEKLLAIQGRKVIKNENNTYCDYLQSVGFTDEALPVVVDLGYSGTIQKCLSELTGENVYGYYLISCERVVSKCSRPLHDGVFRNHGEQQEGQALLLQSLVLEGFLTAPVGQLRGIQRLRDGFIFQRGCDTLSQKFIHLLEVMYEAICEQIFDERNRNVTIYQDKDWVEQYYIEEVRKDSNIYRLLELDDTITGYGFIDPNINRP
jgi:hypothetical protein